jgi:hypothetical protein
VTYHGKVVALDVTTGYVLNSRALDEKGNELTDEEAEERLKHPPYRTIEITLGP